MASTLFPITRGWTDIDRAFNRVIRDAFAPTRSNWAQTAAVSQPIPVDFYANEHQAVIAAALPGVQPGDLDLKVHQNQVTITGKIANGVTSEDAKGATWIAKELWSGEFRRSITLPFAVDTDKVEASFDNGVLRVTLPKAESAKPRTIAINGAAPEQIAETSSAPAEAAE
ncbi:MAG: Hsp20/alpha crystallin family protein [Thermomicrobiales bacterium]